MDVYLTANSAPVSYNESDRPVKMLLAGAQFGKLVDVGGYAVSFMVLASLALVSSALCFVLFREQSAHSVDATV